MYSRKLYATMTYDKNNNPAEELWALEEVTGKGKGLIAKVDIDIGTLVMKDSAVMVVNHDFMLKERVARNMWNEKFIAVVWLELIFTCGILVMIYNTLPIVAAILIVISWKRIYRNILRTKSFIHFHISWNQITKQVRKLSTSTKCLFLQLQNVFSYKDPYQAWLGIFCTNSFQLDDSCSGLFLKAARLNHSCRANCDYSIHNSVMEVRATRPVKQGEELNICYNNFLDENGPVERNERRDYLQWAYRFHCNCEDCSLSSSASRTNDQMRQRVVKLRIDWTLTQDYGKERRIVDEQIGLLRKLDSCGKQEQLLQAVECGWEGEKLQHERTGHHDKARAQALAKLGTKLSQMFLGHESDAVREWKDRQHICKSSSE